jgi:hypothetical protein
VLFEWPAEVGQDPQCQKIKGLQKHTTEAKLSHLGPIPTLILVANA